MKIAVIGANGFVGSSIVSYLKNIGLTPLCVTRASFSKSDEEFDICIDASGSSKKYVAESNPAQDLVDSVVNTANVMSFYPAKLHVLCSSVDVYKELTNPENTIEDNADNVPAKTRYGFHKYLVEEYVKQYATNWLIFRLSGMVGQGLKKNPVFDLLNGGNLWINPKSQFQYMNTQNVARAIWEIISMGKTNDIFNLAGTGTVKFEELALQNNLTIKVSDSILNSEPRIVEVSTDKVRKLVEMPKTNDELNDFLNTAIAK